MPYPTFLSDRGGFDPAPADGIIIR
jgi:hypothetical protein